MLIRHRFGADEVWLAELEARYRSGSKSCIEWFNTVGATQLYFVSRE